MKQRSSRKEHFSTDPSYHSYSAALYILGKKQLQFILPIEEFMFFKPKFCSVVLTYVHFENNSAFAKTVRKKLRFKRESTLPPSASKPPCSSTGTVN